MPEYTLPPIRNLDDPEVVPVSSGENPYPDEWQRSITIPVNNDILEALDVGDRAEISLTGEITAKSKSDAQGEHTRRDLTIKVKGVSAYRQDEKAAEEEAEQDFEKGFNRATAEPY